MRYIALFFLLVQAPQPDPLVKYWTQQLPVWEADKLAQYEQPELAAVLKDLESGDVEQLKIDSDSLQALDNLLANRKVI